MKNMERASTQTVRRTRDSNNGRAAADGQIQQHLPSQVWPGRRMRGVGGPLLCIGDLLHDLADDAGSVDHQGSPSPISPSLLSHSSSSPGGGGGGAVPLSEAPPLQPSDLHGLFQETYNQLTESLMGTDHSWTVLTLKLCSAVETADKLVNVASSNVELLLEKVNMLESILKRGDSAVQIAKAIQVAKTKAKMATDG